MVQLQDLCFAYGEGDQARQILQHIDLHIRKGEFVGLLGRNGSGKSTLGRLLNGLLTPTSGKVLVGGLDTADERNLWDVRRMAGMVFQNPDNQIVATIVEEDVAFGPENLGMEPAEIRRRVDEALERVGMTEFKDRPPHLLSGGQKQRVAIAGVLAVRPDLIIFDEPTAMLDPKGREDVLKTIHELHASGITVILITHFMEEVIDADCIVLLDEGKIALTGTPAEVFDQMDLVEEKGLTVPDVVRLAHGLRQAGVPLPPGILTEEGLVNCYAH